MSDDKSIAFDMILSDRMKSVNLSVDEKLFKLTVKQVFV